MKSMLAILFVLLTCAALPLQAAEPAHGTHSANAGHGYLPDNYLFTFTLERPKKEPLVISMLAGGRDTELANNSIDDPYFTIMLRPTLKENDRLLVDYRIGFRVKIEGDKFIDEGIKGAVYLLPGKEVTLVLEPNRTIKLKYTLPKQL